VTFFGSWVMLFDTSGQVSRDNDSPLLTMAGVAVAKENSQAVRTLVERHLPNKWRDGGLTGFQIAENIIVGQGLRVSVTHLTGIAEAQWQAFWDEGQRQSAKLKEVTKDPAHFASGNSASRLLLFAIVFAHTFGHVLLRRGWKTPAQPDRRDAATFSAIFDTDISDPETRAILTETLRRNTTKGTFATFANLDMDIDACFKTEQDEPLLLLADYVAGVFHHAHRDAVIGKPVAPLPEVRDMAETFYKAMGRNLRIVDQPFTEIHPLTDQMWDT
jgi:hypothetical protein